MSEVSIEMDERIDERGRELFQAMGYTSLTDKMVEVYKEFKLRKDRIHAGPLTPEGMAMVSMLADQPKKRAKQETQEIIIDAPSEKKIDGRSKEARAARAAAKVT